MLTAKYFIITAKQRMKSATITIMYALMGQTTRMNESLHTVQSVHRKESPNLHQKSIKEEKPATTDKQC